MFILNINSKASWYYILKKKLVLVVNLCEDKKCIHYKMYIKKEEIWEKPTINRLYIYTVSYTHLTLPTKRIV